MKKIADTLIKLFDCKDIIKIYLLWITFSIALSTPIIAIGFLICIFSGSDESIKIVFNFALQVLILDTIFVFAVAIIEVVSEIIR